MITLRDMMPYIPENLHFSPQDALYLKSSDGADWYQAIIHFSPDTLKVMYDRNGIIIDANTDASKLWPYGLSVSEVAIDTIPGDFRRPDQQSAGAWVYHDDTITRRVISREEHISRAEKTKATLTETAMKSVAAIQLRLQAGRKLSSEESAKLNAVLDYIDALNATDITHAPDVHWPREPVNVA